MAALEISRESCDEFYIAQKSLIEMMKVMSNKIQTVLAHLYKNDTMTKDIVESYVKIGKLLNEYENVSSGDKNAVNDLYAKMAVEFHKFCSSIDILETAQKTV
jgi:hypothetical protein